MARIFISHSSLDNATAVALQGWLASGGWDDVFLDLDQVRGVAAGERWERRLYEAANRCEAVLFLISRSWLSSEWCLREYDLAVRLNKRIFGILIETIAIAALPARLSATWQLVSLAHGEDHRSFRVVLPSGAESHVTFSSGGLRQLKAGLEKAGLDPRFFAWPPAHDAERAPYRGMRPLEAEDAGIFFGREAPIIAALDQLRDCADRAPPRFLAILGASGSGKSSFLRAGLLPRLARDDRHFLPLPPIRPTNRVLSGETGLLRSLEEAFRERKMPHTRSELRATLKRGVPDVLRLLGELATSVNFPEDDGAEQEDARRAARAPILVMPIDQGEELFATAEEEEAQAFLPLLRELLLTTELRLVVLMTIRSDAFERLQSEPTLVDVQPTPFNLPPLPRGSYQAVIEGPAQRLRDSERPLAIEPALTAALLNDIEEGGAKDALPLLAFTMERLFVEHGGDGDLRLSEYRHLGGIKGSIEAAVERAIESPTMSDAVPKERTERILLLRRALIPWLAGIDPDTLSPRRRVAKLSEIPVEARPLVGLLVAERLLSVDVSAETGETTVEPAHEALLRQWGLLQGWLEEDVAVLSSLEGLLRASRDWAANDQNEGWLVHAGGRLEDAEALLQRLDLVARLEPADRAYLQAARAHETARRDRELEEAKRYAEAQKQITLRQRQVTRRTRIGAIAAIVFALIAIATAGYGWQQASEAKAQRADAEAQRSEAVKQAELAKEQTAIAEEQTKLAEENAAKEEAARHEAESERAATQAQREVAERLLREASTSQVRLLAGMTQEQANKGNGALGMLLASAATNFASSSDLKSLAILERNAWYACRLNREITAIKAVAPTAALLVPEGDAAVIGERGGRLLVQMINTDLPIQSFETGIDDMQFLIFDPSSQLLAAASSTQIVSLALSGSRPPVKIEVGEHPIQMLKVDNAPQPLLRVFHEDGTVGLRRLDDLSLVKTISEPQGGTVKAVLSEDLKQMAFAQQSVAAGLVDTNVYIRSLGDGGSVIELAGHENIVRALDLSPSGKYLATGSSDNTLKLWDLAKGTLLRNIIGHSGGLTVVTFRQDGAVIASADITGEIRLWDTETGERLVSPIRGHNGAIVDLRFDSSGNMLISTSMDGTVRVWDVRPGRETVFSRSYGDAWSQETAWNDAARRSPEDASGRLLDRQRCAEFFSADAATKPGSGHLQPYLPTIVSDDGRHVASVGPDGILTVANTFDATDLLRIELSVRDLDALWGTNVVFSPTLNAFVSFNTDMQQNTPGNGYSVWNLSNGQPIAASADHAAQILFNPDGRRLFVRLSDGRIRIHDGVTGAILGEDAHGGGHHDIVIPAFDPSLVLLVAPGHIDVWDMATGIAPLLAANASIQIPSLSEDGRYAVFSFGDFPNYAFELWDIRNRVRVELPSELKNFSSDGADDLKFLHGSDVLVRKLSDQIELWRPGEWIKEGKIALGEYEYLLAFDRKLGRTLRAGNLLTISSFPENNILWSEELPDNSSLFGAEPCGDGRRLVHGDTFDPYILDMETGEPLRVFQTGSSDFITAKCVDGGRLVAIQAMDQVNIFDFRSNDAERFEFLSRHLRRCMDATEVKRFGFSFLIPDSCKAR